ncbi:PEP-CTERM sorting domain-containing protein [Roseibacillus ishigakijimensis]|uniref:PEP-CTERM sorting domain-containing protein n=1 Tax=Roseibacillus ishigakijimensis TaxID=454146 RepID=A0A934RRF5_9BACT|nr:PEP-CTERM sorting domain-containing protein [Roseibacillus ishigakijimensis]MBK1832890.1 PEP-CTERM sorting domain-containing protein [Roseibacillus ishigakijimensis]
MKMKSLLALSSLALLASGEAAMTYQFAGDLYSSLSVDPTPVSGQFTFDESKLTNQGAPGENLLAQDVTFEITLFGQTFSKSDESGYLGESEIFYALNFINNTPSSFFFAIAETQEELDRVAGIIPGLNAKPGDFPLDQATLITDPTIEAFIIDVSDPAGFTAIPEPSAALLLVLGATGFLRRRR